MCVSWNHRRREYEANDVEEEEEKEEEKERVHNSTADRFTSRVQNDKSGTRCCWASVEIQGDRETNSSNARPEALRD